MNSLTPILLAPAAMHRLAHRDGELATAKGAGAANSAIVLSTLTNYSAEEVLKAATTPVYFQLYVEPDRGVTKALMQRAEAAGVKAFFVTVDTPSHRCPQCRSARSIPPSRQMGTPPLPSAIKARFRPCPRL